jgi:hypothetical protein
VKKYSKDGKVCFNPENHTYFIGDKQLTSVTTYLSQFKNKFDSELIATKYAKKNGLNKLDVLKEWKDKAELSAKNGTICHSIFENYILNDVIELPGIAPKEKVAKKFINDYFERGLLIPVETEMIVYDENLAGQIDCIAKNKSGEYFILDWKTNNKIDKTNYNKFMLGDYDIYPDANYYHYSLQLSLYRKMCKEYDIKNCFIIHLDIDNYEVIECIKIKIK